MKNRNLITQSVGYNDNNYIADNHHFALCELCFWTATILMSSNKKHDEIINQCPICFNKNISIIPLAKEEIYELSFRPKGGLEIKFSRSILA